MIRIPYSHWLSWSDQERGQMLEFLEGKQWYFDMDQKSENVQADYQDEADAQGVNIRKLV